MYLQYVSAELTVPFTLEWTQETLHDDETTFKDDGDDGEQGEDVRRGKEGV